MTKAGAIVLVSAAIAASGIQTAMASAPTPAAKHPGRALFERAEAHFNHGRFEDARADYQAAYDLEPLPAFLFNIGQCYRNLGDYERAQFFFQRYAMLDPQSPTRETAETLIAEMKRLNDARRLQARPQPMASVAAARAVDVQAGRDDGAKLTLEQRRESPAPPPPLYRRAWFWAGLGGALLLGTAAAYAFSHDGPRGTLRPIDAR